MEIDGNHLPGAGDPGRHHRRKTEGSGTEDGKRLPRPHLEHVEYGARTGLNSATERTQDIQGRVPAHLDHAPPVSQGMGGKGRLIEEAAMHRAVIAVQIMSPVGNGYRRSDRCCSSMQAGRYDNSGNVRTR